MIGTETISRVIGQDVYDEAGEKIGSASEVYLDDETGQPEWVTVRTGLFGTKESFVPIRDADLTNDGVRVPVSKERVKDAPKIDTDGHLSPAEEEELYRYYGYGTGTTAGTRAVEATAPRRAARSKGSEPASAARAARRSCCSRASRTAARSVLSSPRGSWHRLTRAPQRHGSPRGSLPPPNPRGPAVSRASSSVPRRPVRSVRRA